MAFAVELYFDAITDENVRRAWRAIIDAGISSSMLDGGYRPHVSLGVSNQLNVNEACKALASFAVGVSPFTLTLSSIGVFPAEGVVFLGVTVTEKLLDLHARFHHIFQECAKDQWDYYHVGRWVPHCTLAFGLSTSRVAEAVSASQQITLPIHAQVKEIGVVEVSRTNCNTLCLYHLGRPTNDG